MATDKVLHMNGGVGETSYANNSLVQRKVMLKTKPFLKENMTRVYTKILPNCVSIADLGCSSGPNTFLAVSEIMRIVHEIRLKLKNNSKPPSFQIFLNDLPGNDFNIIFKSLPQFHKRIQQAENQHDDSGRPCFIFGAPGSFYERLFPNSSVHFFHSSYSVHWLSQVPKGMRRNGGGAMNKGDIYITKTSPCEVRKAYVDQFQEDFSLFLKHRSLELVHDGGMVLTFLGRIEDEDPTTTFNLIGMALYDMVLENKVEESKLDYFDVPFYAPTEEEVRQIIEGEGSFTIERLEIFKMGWDGEIINESDEVNNVNNNGVIVNDNIMKAKFIANYMRAIIEPLVQKHFGDEIMDDLFSRFTSRLLQLMEVKQLIYSNLVISLTNNN